MQNCGNYLSCLLLKMKYNLGLGHSLDFLIKFSKKDFPFPNYEHWFYKLCLLCAI